MSLFTGVDLSALPPPSIVEELDYEDILAAVKGELQRIAPEIVVDSLLESDPVSKLLQVMTYREMHLRQRINESAQGVMLATATGANLDNLAALVNIQRSLIEPGDPDASIDPVYEDDDRLRKRTQMAFEGFSTAGPRGAYLFHALSASALVKDVAVYSDFPGEVEVRILSTEGNGLASDDLLAKVSSVLNADEIRPITDLVKVKSADIVPYTIDATLILSPGVGSQVVLESVRAAAQGFIDRHSRLGSDITRAALFSALHHPGVKNIELREPSADILIEQSEAPFGTIAALDSTEHPTSAPLNMAAAVIVDGQNQEIGKVVVTPANDERDITHYVLYWGGSNAQKLPLGTKIYESSGAELILDHDNAINLLIANLDSTIVFRQGPDYTVDNNRVTALNALMEDAPLRVTYDLPAIARLKKGGDLTHVLDVDIGIPSGATHILVFTENEFGEMVYGVSTEI